MPGSYTYFLEVIHTCQKRKSSKILLKVKNRKLSILKDFFLMQKLRNATKKIDIPCSLTYFLEVGAHVLLRVSTKGYFNGKKILTN